MDQVQMRLRVLMFLEYFILGAWVVPGGGYFNSVLGFTGPQIGMIYATAALGAVLSPPIVGHIADRFFPAERILGVLQILAGICLAVAAGQDSFLPLATLMVLHALFFMPTLALANSITLRNIPNPAGFSRLAVFGTVGWIASGLIIGLLFSARSGAFFGLAGGVAVLLGLFSFALPHTPPKGAQTDASPETPASHVMRQPGALVFVVTMLLIVVAASFNTTWTNAFLREIGAPRPTALMTLCQFSEIGVMILMPHIVERIGLKWVLVCGMIAWVFRYGLYGSLYLPLVVLGLLLHGFCYCFVNIAAFLYADRVAPTGMSARAQSFVAVLVFGLGVLLGSQVAGVTAQFYVTGSAGDVRHVWLPVWLWPAALALVSAVLFSIGGREPARKE